MQAKALTDDRAAEKGMRHASWTFLSALRRKKRFFYFFACNPLKSPDSAKELQVNPKIFFLRLFAFAWFFLDRRMRKTQRVCSPVG
jgi:hypothetical protein